MAKAFTLAPGSENHGAFMASLIGKYARRKGEPPAKFVGADVTEEGLLRLNFRQGRGLRWVVVGCFGKFWVADVGEETEHYGRPTVQSTIGKPAVS